MSSVSHEAYRSVIEDGRGRFPEDAFSTCTEDSGNSYNVQPFGNQTFTLLTIMGDG